MRPMLRPGALPVPGVVWGAYPERSDSAARRRTILRGLSRILPGHKSLQELAAVARARSLSWRALSAQDHKRALTSLRAHLRREGFNAGTIADALGCVAAAGQSVLGIELYDCQLFAAVVMLDGRLAEMATGEGKTHAAAAAAAVAALAAIPVHVVTANDYLVTRDAADLRPLYAALGLEVQAVTGETPPDERRGRYAADVVYCTARELVFDYLRDGLARDGRREELEHRAAAVAGLALPQPLLRGLCMAIVDEADSVLLDEATVPLVLSREAAQPGQRALLWQALAIARELAPGVDFQIASHRRAVELNETGHARIGRLTQSLTGAWRSRRRREELVATAAAALHLYRRDRDYLVRDGRVEIVDEVTGRTATGRVWSRGLHGLIELKEGCAVSADTQTIAQITYQRFFPRYLHLTGVSGTLREARRELSSLYGLRVAAVPLRRACRRVRLPTRLFLNSSQLWAAVATRVAGLRAQGRPVLIGTDSVADSEALSAVLAAAGISHTVLNARHDRAEADIVAQAGRSGAVTVATNMAGRGTDITLGPGVAHAGGLHVLCCQHNGVRRTERQLVGRCARQGDAGSAENWLALEALRLGPVEASGFPKNIRKWVCSGISPGNAVAEVLADLPRRFLEILQAAQRRRLLQQDREWARRCLFAPARE